MVGFILLFGAITFFGSYDTGMVIKERSVDVEYNNYYGEDNVKAALDDLYSRNNK